MDELVDFLLAAVKAVVQYFGGCGITQIPHYQYEAHWMEPVELGRSEGRTATYTEPDIGGLLTQHRKSLETSSAIADFGAKLTNFADAYGGFPPSSLHPSLANIANRVLQLYFSRSGTLTIDETIARKVVENYCADLSSPTITARSVFQVENFSAIQAFDLSEEIRFRPIAMDDIKVQARRSIAPPPFDRPWLNLKDWICEVNKKGPRETFEAFNWHNDGIRHICTTLALVFSGRASLTLLSSRAASPFLGWGTISNPNPTFTALGGAGVSLDERKIKLAQGLYPVVVSIFTEPRYRRLRLSLSRFIGAAQRRQPEDQLVDYVVGLESLLAPDTERLETTFRLRLRGAAILPRQFGGERERIKLLNDLYEQRSQVVHGDAESRELAIWVPKAEDVLRNTLLWYLNGLPDRGNPQDVTKQLDEQLVKGGAAWAYPG